MRTETRSLTTWLLALGVTLPAACATEPAPRPAQLDPSNPSAPESAPLTAAPAAAPAAAAKAQASPDGSGPAVKAAGALYTCPMHPEVVSDKPGKCPKCGMTLVPKEPGSTP